MLEAWHNLVLIGLRGAGKSTLARHLAGVLSRRCVDLDDELAARAGCSVDEFLVARGEAAFRLREREVLEWAASLRGCVIATGGGAVLHAEQARALAATGLVVHLDPPPELLLARARARPRPPLTTLPLRDEIAALRAARGPAYAALAQLTVRTGDPSPILAFLSGWSAAPR